VRLVVADTSVWARERQPRVAALIATAARANVLAMIVPVTLELLRSARTAARLRHEARRYDRLRQIEVTCVVEARARAVQETLAQRGYHRGPSPVDLLLAAAAESVDAELWHCDRHFELIADVTGQPMRRIGE
jgi:predicted nucleic acid-binding protein